MKYQSNYKAKESFTFPLFCLVCLVSFIYCGRADEWPVGAIVGTSFFGTVILVYVFKYFRFGRDFLRIDTNDYSVFTNGEGLYGESEEDYPVFVSKLGYKDKWFMTPTDCYT